MNYYVRYNNQTIGPFSEQQISNFLQQGRFDDSVRFSTDLTRWYPPWEVSSFRNIPLQKSSVSNEDTKPRHKTSSKKHKKSTSDHSMLYFMGFCLVAILGFTAIIYAINKVDSGSSEDDTPIEVKENFTAESLPAVYQKKQRAIGLVTITFQDKEGGHSTVPIGTAFAISKNKFVTNAHVAYAVKNGFEENLVFPVLKYHFNEEAKKKNKTLDAYLRKIGERGIEQARIKLLEYWKERGVKIRDIEIRLNHSNGESFRVAKVQVHPRYNPTAKETGEFDVAVLEIIGKTDCYFEVASSRELYSLKTGTPVASAGFPMEGLQNRDLNINKPEASYASGDIKKITDFENKDGGNKNNKSITHSIPAAGGASGSPIFVANGKVVAVLWGVHHGLRTNQGRVPSGLLHNYAVRIDQIKYLSEPVSWSSWVNDPTKNISYHNRQRDLTPTYTQQKRTSAESTQRVDRNTDGHVNNNTNERANAKAEYDRLTGEIRRRNKRLVEVSNAYDAVKVLIGIALLTANKRPSRGAAQELIKLNKQMKDLDLCIEQERAALSHLNARKEELRIKYNF